MTFFCYALTVLSLFMAAPEPDQVRAQFKLAPKSEQEADKLLALLAHSSPEKNPTFYAYLGAVTTMKASWAFWPNQKLDYAGKGMKMLHDAIKADPTNLEIRWLRFSVESQMPSFLGYDHQREDKSVLFTQLKSESIKRQAGAKWLKDIAAFMKLYGKPSAEELSLLNWFLRS